MDDGSNEKSILHMHMQILNIAFANMQALVQCGCSSIQTTLFLSAEFQSEHASLLAANL